MYVTLQIVAELPEMSAQWNKLAVPACRIMVHVPYYEYSVEYREENKKREATYELALHAHC